MNEQSYIEKMIKFGNKIQDDKNSNQFDMFGNSIDSLVKAPDLMIVMNGQLWIYYQKKKK